ncbi:MAG: DMT family transporter [Thermoplasmata archaeon]|nr:DMT family transporter [Thermoplasmata archaeon]
MSPTSRLYLILAATVLIWANSFLIVDVAIRDGASPVMIAMGRFLVASAIFGAYVVWKRPRVPEASDRRRFLLLAFIGIGVYYIFQFYGVKFAGPSVSSILIFLLSPIMIFILSSYRLGERSTPPQKVGLVLSAAGAFMVITDGNPSFAGEWTAVLGGLLGVICAAFWAIYTVEGKKVVGKYDPVASTAQITLLGTMMLAPFAVADSSLTGQSAFPISFFVAALYLGVLCTVVGYVFWFRALEGLSASSTGVTMYFIPLATVLFGWLLLDIEVGMVAAIGGIFVTAGVVLVSRN